jgi:hypothetical protein
MAWLDPHLPGDVQTVPRPVEQIDERALREPTRRERLVRWLSEHKLLVTIAAALLFLASLALAFEAGHAYAEGVRSLGGFVEHLGGMYDHYFGDEQPMVGGWRWAYAWLWGG